MIGHDHDEPKHSAQGPNQHEADSDGRTSLSVRGMNCANCARSVTEALQAVPGVASAVVQLDQARAEVRWGAGVAADAPALVRSVKEAGYDASELSSEVSSEGSVESAFAVWRFQVIFALIFTVPLIIGEWVLGLGLKPEFQWISFAFAAPVLVVCGSRFYRGAWQQLKRGSSNMDTLVALGSTTAFGYSAWGLLAGFEGHLYFMEAAAIITFISIGHWLEAIAGARAASSLRALVQLAPETAVRLATDGAEELTPVAELKPGDRVLLRPGDRVPADGRVQEGSSAVDESMLTGESIPCQKTIGAEVYAGTINHDGRLVVGVTGTDRATALARIIELVEHAQSSRANIQKLGDRVSGVFVPIVVVVAILTGIWWGIAYESARQVHVWLGGVLWHSSLPSTPLAAAMIHATAVLIVACPCAMGLATPVAIMAGTNVGARRGILIRDGLALEKSGLITTVMFDKTGTLTVGRPEVVAFEEVADTKAAGGNGRVLAASLARPSNHPLSQAIARSTPGEIPLAEWRELRGQGIEARLAQGSAADGLVVRLGSLNWLTECGVAVSPGSRIIDEWSAKGATVLGVAANQNLLAVVALRDELKPSVRAVLDALRQQGKRVRLVTGDRSATAIAIAAAAGFTNEEVFAEVRPERKAEIVRELQGRGEKVAFVGDGINDAPALEQADLGIAVSRASDVAREAADIILLKSDIHAIPEALGLAHATLRTIKQNLFWAFFYNAAGVPLAALGFLSPVVCALAMGLSDLVVIGNALRLRRWK